LLKASGQGTPIILARRAGGNPGTSSAIGNSRKSDALQIKTNALEKETNTAAARDRKKAGMDSLQKFLDMLHSMNPQL
jgi:hypothetical protein